MIEIIQETEKKKDMPEAKLPKNIRQIGNPETDFRIYMEDYVYTYLHPARIGSIETSMLPRLLILVGEIEHFANRSCAFISGAILAQGDELEDELLDFNEKIWRGIHRDMEQYFQSCEIVGWVLDIPGNALKITPEMEMIHSRNFRGKYQFFFLMDSGEREEAFYIWKNGGFSRKEGYFIYYEKNPQMQEYMISRRKGKGVETSGTEQVSDRAAQSYRAVMKQKKEKAYKRRSGFLTYLSSLLMVFVLCAVSVLLIGNIRRMEQVEQSISAMSVAMADTQQAVAGETQTVTVENIKSTVIPQTQTQSGEDQQLSQTDAANEADQTVSTENSQTASAENAADENSQAVSAGNVADENSQITSQPETAGNDSQSAIQPEGAEDGQAAAQTPQVLTEAQRYRAQGYYIVQAGDSLRQICAKIYGNYDMLDALCNTNGIDDMNAIYIGQKLLLP